MALVRIERRGVAFLVGLNRPERHNAFDEAMVTEFDRALTAAAREPCVVIVHSTTPGIFAAGADISELVDRDADAALRGINAGLFERLEAHRWPTVALVDGPAYGGGCELALACDMRIASPRARFAQPEPALGILAGAGANWRLPQLAGTSVARRMLYTGEVLDADAALSAGLVDMKVPPDTIVDAGLALAKRIAERSWRALEFTKLALRLHRPATTTFDVAAQAMLFDSAEKRERMSTFLTGGPERRRAEATGSEATGSEAADSEATRSEAAAAGPAVRAVAGPGPREEPDLPFHVRSLTVEDALDLAMSPQPGAWQVYDALEPFPPDEGYWTVADAKDRLVGYCCLGEAARVAGAPGDPTYLDVAIGIRPDLAGRGWGAELGRAATAYAREVALDRGLRTTVPEWNEVGIHVAEESDYVRVDTVTYGRQKYVVLEQPGIPPPAVLD